MRRLPRRRTLPSVPGSCSGSLAGTKDAEAGRLGVGALDLSCHSGGTSARGGSQALACRERGGPRPASEGAIEGAELRVAQQERDLRQVPAVVGEVAVG